MPPSAGSPARIPVRPPARSPSPPARPPPSARGCRRSAAATSDAPSARAPSASADAGATGGARGPGGAGARGPFVVARAKVLGIVGVVAAAVAVVGGLVGGFVGGVGRAPARVAPGPAASGAHDVAAMDAAIPAPNPSVAPTSGARARSAAGPASAPSAAAPSAATPPGAAGRALRGVDAVFVEREAVWWLVDDGARRASAPLWSLDPRDARTLGPDVAREVRDAIERGEGGGYADRTGWGPPPAPTPEEAAGVPLVALARDVACVLRSDDTGVEHAVRATRLAESDDRAGDDPAPDDETGRALAVRARVPRLGTGPPETAPLEAARRRALDGDATETLRLVALARGLEPRVAPAPLAALEAQALLRLGRPREAADLLRALADGARDDRLAAAALGLEALARDRADDLEGARTAREDADDLVATAPRPTDPLDAALGALPDLVRTGRRRAAVGDVARALRDGDPSAARSAHRRRAVLAAAALALEEGDLDAAARLLRHGAAPPLSAGLAEIATRLSARLAGRAHERAPPERPRPPDPARGVGNRPRGG